MTTVKKEKKAKKVNVLGLDILSQRQYKELALNTFDSTFNCLFEQFMPESVKKFVEFSSFEEDTGIMGVKLKFSDGSLVQFRTLDENYSEIRGKCIRVSFVNPAAEEFNFSEKISARELHNYAMYCYNYAASLHNGGIRMAY